MAQITQINLNHCAAAQQLLWQSVLESGIDVAIVADPYRIPFNNGKWIADKERMTAIWTPGRYPVQEVVTTSKAGYAIAKVNGVYYCSVYAPPRWSTEEFTSMVDSLSDELIGRSPVVIAGDFNAWAVEWGSRSTNLRGQILLEALAKLNVEIANVGSTSTYYRNGAESIIDITFCSPCLADGMDWRVDSGYTHSDHQAIRYQVKRNGQQAVRGHPTPVSGWKTASFVEEVFTAALGLEQNTEYLSSEELVAALSRACDATMPRKAQPRGGRRSTYWWCEEVAALRASCLQARRRMQRARTEEEREERHDVLRAAKAALKKEIVKRKRGSFEELCRAANANPWGDAYKVVMAKTKGAMAPQEKSPELLAEIITVLFPQHEETPWPLPPDRGIEGEDTVPRVTNEELVAVAKSLVANKAPGPDGIPNVAIKAAIHANPDMVRSTMQRCLDECTFPDSWKRQKLVLLPKPGKPPGEASAYRPICLLDTTGKLLEKLILSRLEKYTEGDGGLSNSQFGFRKGRSTIDAIQSVINTAKVALEHKRRGTRYCAVVTLDVKNAFNSASWEAIAQALIRLKVPADLCRILGSYFRNRVLLYDTEEGQKSMRITAGVPQGSILGPALWNAMYDGVLRLKFSPGVKIVGFADDITLLVYGESVEEIELTASHSISVVEEWMRSRKLALAHHKTEVIVVNNRRSEVNAVVNAGNCTIDSKRSLKLLGIMIDDKLNFASHVEYICKRAKVAVTALSRMMSNSSAVSASKRKVLSCVALSILRYGGPAWFKATRVKRNLQRLESTYRLMCLRVASAYRTVSGDAVCVISNMMPIGIILREDEECRERRDMSDARSSLKAESARRWQREWDNSTKGRWTHQLIPSIEMWTNRRHGEVNFHLTQMLSGHGCFRSYLHRFGHARSPTCPHCADADETPEHVLFHCQRFDRVRDHMRSVCGPDTTVGNIVAKMCSDPDKWNAVASAVTHMVNELQRKWRIEQHDQRQ